MKIIEDKKQTSLLWKDVPLGDVIRWHGKLFMKIHCHPCYLKGEMEKIAPAINLEDSSSAGKAFHLSHFSPEVVVEPVKTQLVVEV